MRSSCTNCPARERCAQSNLELFPSHAAAGELLASTLREHHIAFESDLNLFSVRGPQSHAQVIGLLREVLNESEREGIRVLSAAATLTLDEWWSTFENTWFGRALAANRFVTWFQPVVEVSEGPAFPARTIAHECLIRLCDGRVYNGSEIVEAACACNEMRAFDSYARRLAIHSAAQQSPEGLYFINFMPSSIYNARLCLRSSIEAVEEAGMHAANFVFEVVESDVDQNLAHLVTICDYCRSQGFGFALDDVGRTGSNSLGMVAALRPDYIKLDRCLIENLDQLTYMPAIIRQLVNLARHMGVTVIAEGVERSRTVERLLELGVRHMQGYLFGLPAPRLAEAVIDQEETFTRRQVFPT